MKNQARIFLKRARATTRKCRAAGLPSPFTVNSAGNLVVNPAVSEAQRRYLNSTFGHDWVKEHDFDNHGHLPEKVKAENERRMAGECTANESTFFGRFFRWLTNAKSAPSRDTAGQFSSGDDDADEAEAAEKGVSVDELRKHREAGEDIKPAHNSNPEGHNQYTGGGGSDARMQSRADRSQEAEESSGLARREPTAKNHQAAAELHRGIKDDILSSKSSYGYSSFEYHNGRQKFHEGKAKSLTTNRRRVLVANARRCPECGGRMEDGECEECDYTENAALMVDQDADDRTISSKGGDADPDGRHTAKIKRRAPIDVVDDDGDPYLDEDDPYLDEDDHSDLVRDDQIAATRNQPYQGPDPHQATKQAVASSVMTEHTGARDSAIGAMDASSEDDSELASKQHLQAAKVHEDAATGARGDGEHMEAEDHDQAAALHRKAASMHRASMSFNRWFATNMPAGGAFSGAKAAGFSPAQAAAMAGKLEGSYHGGEEHHPVSTGAKKASEHAEKTKSKSAHRAAASAHKEAAEHHENEGNPEMASAHHSAARSHAAKASRMSRNSRGSVVNWRQLLMNDPLITNMPAGGAYSGAMASGYSQAQAAAMAGKLEGSYDSSGETGKGGSSHTREAKDATAHAERTKSKSAHKAAATAHKEAADHHRNEGNSEMASSHASAARSHAAKAARAVRNSYIDALIENCTCPETRAGLLRLVANEPDAIGTEGSEMQVGGEEDDEFGDDAGIPDKVRLKKKEFTGNAYLAQLPQDIRETITEARSVVNREKRALIQRLTVNVRDPGRREYRIQQLMGRDLRELRGMLELIGNSAPPAQPGEIMPLPMYGSDNTSIVDNVGDDGDDVLDCPTINFKPARAV